LAISDISKYFEKDEILLLLEKLSEGGKTLCSCRTDSIELELFEFMKDKNNFSFISFKLFLTKRLE
jgi:hypothetical protein|tara:strand:+ start:6492 stop:6689 length:198 start_codon:yes stop_codon:yes gene_type:complete